MLRINCFFRLKDENDAQQVKLLAKELIEKSRTDEGNIAYDLFQSATEPKNMMFCETWKDLDALKAHAAAPHFTSIVPQIEGYAEGPMKLEQFDF